MALRFCVFHKLPCDINAAGPGITLGKTRLYTLPGVDKHPGKKCNLKYKPSSETSHSECLSSILTNLYLKMEGGK